jgi:hypothetical protein
MNVKITSKILPKIVRAIPEDSILKKTSGNQRVDIIL